jgi:hypothetical protein
VRRASQRVAYFGKRIGCGVRDQRAGQQAQQPQTRKNRSRAAFSLLPCAGPGTGATGKRKSVCVGSPRVIRPIEVGAPLPVPGLAPLWRCLDPAKIRWIWVGAPEIGRRALLGSRACRDGNASPSGTTLPGGGSALAPAKVLALPRVGPVAFRPCPCP